MAKRRKPDAAPSFDSLLDTMTNVVGILVILLAVTQMGVRTAVQKIQDNLPEVSAEQLEETRQSVALLEQVQAQPEPEAQPEELQKRLAALEEELKKSKEEVANKQKLIAEQQRLKKEEEKEKQGLDALNAKMDEAEKTARELQQKLAQMPGARQAPSRVIRIPDPRPAPDGAEPVYAFVHHNRVLLVDINAMREKVYRGIVAKRSVVEAGDQPPSNPKRPTVKCDPEKLKGFIAAQGFGLAGFKSTFSYNLEKNYRTVSFTPSPTNGETPAQIALPTSAFLKRLSEGRRDKKYVRYFVWTDSFETYMLARTISDRMGIGAGWDLVAGEAYSTYLSGEIQLNGATIPPPAPKPPPAKPGTSPKPANVLD